MKRHIVGHVGAADTFDPTPSGGDPIFHFWMDTPGHPRRVGNDILQRLARKGLYPTPSAVDLLQLAIAAYSADLRVPRAKAPDRWTRDLQLYLPVVDPSKWERARETLIRFLAFLTGDRWELHFRPRSAPEPRADGVAPSTSTPTVVSLFSGGLDSFAGAVDLLEQHPLVALVGHYADGRASQAQINARAHLEGSYEDQTWLFRFWVQPPSFPEGGREPTQRSRSILFLALGTLTADAIGTGTPLVVPENGYISLNVPLTPARTGSLSTRTTHPYLMALYRELLAELGLTVPIEMPYQFATKGEMLRNSRNPVVLQAGAHWTLSCAHPGVGRYAGGRPDQHCGYCVPCIIRRASLKAAGVIDTDYFRNILTDPPTPDSERGRDLRAFLMATARLRGAPPYRFFFDVLHTGPLSQRPDEVQQYAAVYQRGVDEVRAFLDGITRAV